MSESESNSKIKTDIPFLFYDVIGRMMPGAYLIFGILVCFSPFLTRQQFVCFLEKVQRHTPDSAIAVSLIGICLVLFLCASAFCGFLLASLSHLLVEKPWGMCSPFTYDGMKKFLGESTATSIGTRFEGRFGIELKKLKSLNRASFICAYDIWRADVNLGQMQGRHDADLLAAQSFVLVSIILSVFIASETEILGQPIPHWPFIVLAGIGVCAFLSFKYHRKKRVYGRFEMFLALSDPALVPLTTQPKSNTPEVVQEDQAAKQPSKSGPLISL